MKKLILPLLLNLLVLSWVVWRVSSDALTLRADGALGDMPVDAWLAAVGAAYMLIVFVVQAVRATRRPARPVPQLNKDMVAFLRILVASKDDTDLSLVKPAARRLLDQFADEKAS